MVPSVGWSNAGTLRMTMTNSCMRLGGDTRLARLLSPLVYLEILPVENGYWSASLPGGWWVDLSKLGFFFVLCGNYEHFISL